MDNVLYCPLCSAMHHVAIGMCLLACYVQPVAPWLDWGMIGWCPTRYVVNSVYYRRINIMMWLED